MNGSRDALQDYLDNSIPLVGAMQVTVAAADARCVVLKAPLAPNINHQGTAFGGSVAGLATLACWGWLWNTVHGGPATQLVVAHSDIDYVHPVRTSLTASCTAPDAAIVETFLQTLQRRGRARIALGADVTDDDGTVCARMRGRFAAIREVG